MKDRLEEIPRYRSGRSTVPAPFYNLVHLALLRLQPRMRFPLPGLRSLEMILQADCWVCVDSNCNDIPVLAWLDFATEHRADLHKAIECKLYLYHAHAYRILGRVQDAVTQVLDERLHPHRAHPPDRQP